MYRAEPDITRHAPAVSPVKYCYERIENPLKIEKVFNI